MNAKQFEELTSDCDNIIFDYGGVFVDIKHRDAISGLQKLSNSGAAEELYNKHSQSEIFNWLETGNITPEEFVLKLKQRLEIDAEDKFVLDAWCSMLKDHPRARVDYLRTLAKRKRVFMLSNINEIHEKYLQSIVASSPGIKDFYQLFEKVYFSHKIGLRKPDAGAFRTVLDESGLDPAKTAFIDDTVGHVEAAKRLGLKGILLDPPNRFIS